MKAVFLSILLLVGAAFAQSDPTNGGSCSTEEMRRAAVDRALATIGCDNYDCGKQWYQLASSS